MKTTLKIILRGWQQNKFYTLISFISLTIGLTTCIPLVSFLINEYQIVHYFPQKEQCYLVTNNKNQPFWIGKQSEWEKNYPEIKATCLFRKEEIKLFSGKEEQFNEQAYSVTPNLTTLFPFQVLAGDLQRTLNNKQEIAVTRSFARKYLGKENPLGEFLALARGYAQIVDGNMTISYQNETYRITTVIDDQCKSPFAFEILIGSPYQEMPNHNFSLFYKFIQLHSTAEASVLIRKINQEQNSPQNTIYLKSLPEIYFSHQIYIYDNDLFHRQSYHLLYICSTVILFPLIIASFNHINIYLIRSIKQLKNNSIQFVFGAISWNIYRQLLVESTLFTTGALLLTLPLIYGLLPTFNLFLQNDLHFNQLFSKPMIGLLIFLSLLFTLIPVVYIGKKLQCNHPVKWLKQAHTQQKNLLHLIVIIQFSLSITLFIFMFSIRNQLHYIAYNRPHVENILCIEGGYNDLKQQDQVIFQEKLSMIPEITCMTSSNLIYPLCITRFDTIIETLYTDRNFFSLFDIPIIEGRNFSTGETAHNEVIINECLAKYMGWKHPIGKTLGIRFIAPNHRIVGVIQDYASGKFTEAIRPLVIFRIHHGHNTLCLRTQAANVNILKKKLQTLWEKEYTEFPPLTLSNLKEQFLKLHSKEVLLMEIITIFTWLNILLSLLGLFSLACFSVKNRRKEIGLRKINGATEREIVILLCRRFFSWILIAFSIATPIGYYLSTRWLQQFALKVSVSGIDFLWAGGFALIVGFVSIIFQTIQAAQENPINTTKTE